MTTGACIGSMIISTPECTECLTFSDFGRHLQRGDTGDKNANAKKKWFEEKQKRKHAELEKLGLDTTEIHRIETAEQVDITAPLRPVPRTPQSSSQSQNVYFNSETSSLC